LIRRAASSESSARVVEAIRHQVHERAGGRAERRPVELVVRDEPVVLVAAAARKANPVDDGVCGTREPVEAAERRQRHACLLPVRTRERVPARESVVHAITF